MRLFLLLDPSIHSGVEAAVLGAVSSKGQHVHFGGDTLAIRPAYSEVIRKNYPGFVWFIHCRSLYFSF